MVTDALARNAKANLRAEVRRRRRARSASVRETATGALTENLIALVRRRGPALLGCYLSGADEPNTRPFLSWAAANGVDVLVPVSRRDGLLDWVHARGGAEQPGLFGISEMVGEVVEAAVFQSVDLLLIPAAAVDDSGMRMGWGRGYFDRALASLEEQPPVFALVYDDELVESVPRESHDKPVVGVVTPSRIHEF
ncbi:5-formyltetrahydrofolate cyclo-ligase [Arthrobacter sp. ISL-72]|uniref:5-formyltetrahydrofolate cyclo-ligase n=1 Tax=Arthrobacter sp. ISL-72 TaxID=2819114 RepID=UPI001BE78D4C|nr:5-formyltetrahydrofolate cyclo-ligase [Arthrobacter sp. ISL-72]MBT2595030.1 5-formyltetrahydrofolate cyclo-ligase [Arthrobacter sp. ISL-72]